MRQPAWVFLRDLNRLERTLLTGCTLILLSTPVLAQSFSMSTNFDGGLGGGSASFSRFQRSSAPSNQSSTSPGRSDTWSPPPRRSDRSSPIDSGYAVYVAFEENLRKEQAERGAREA